MGASSETAVSSEVLSGSSSISLPNAVDGRANKALGSICVVTQVAYKWWGSGGFYVPVLQWSGDRIDQVYPQHAQVRVWFEVKWDESILCYATVQTVLPPLER